jgi:hypothetical protein
MALRRSGVRIPLGPPTKTHLEPRQISVEQFLGMLQFEHRAKLEELPDTTR